MILNTRHWSNCTEKCNKPSNLLLCHHSARVLWIFNSFLFAGILFLLLLCILSAFHVLVQFFTLFWGNWLADWLEVYLWSFGGGVEGRNRNTRGLWRVFSTILPLDKWGLKNLLMRSSFSSVPSPTFFLWNLLNIRAQLTDQPIPDPSSPCTKPTPLRSPTPVEL